MDNKTSELIELIREWTSLNAEERFEKFNSLDRDSAEDLFLVLSASDKAEIICNLPTNSRRSWLRLLPLDDTADLIQHLPEELKQSCLSQLDMDTRLQVQGLLAYAADDAGGLMTPHFIKLRPDMEVEVAIRYLRTYSRKYERTIYYTYVVDANETLIGILSFRELLIASPEKVVSTIMKKEFISVQDTMDQEEVAKVFLTHRLSAIPVVDKDKKLKGIVTYDDIAQAVKQETTEDIQKIGGMEALDLPYWKTSALTMIQKRAGWLTALFLGEMLTASAMAHYEDEISKAVVLALFIPLIISSGGNSGSQATTLIIRAMALGEIKLKDWGKVLVRELGSGLVLGLILGTIGIIRIMVWPNKIGIYGIHYKLLALTVGVSLVGVVLWGATAGAMLPFLLRKLKLDPASASAPFVATIVDVTGLVIYFTTASLILTGTIIH